MKISKIFAIASAAVLIVACGAPAVEGSKETRDLLPKKAQLDSASYLVGVNFGYWIKNNNFSDLNYNEIVKGIKDFMKAEGDQQDSAFVKQFKINPEEMNRIVSEFIEKRNAYTAAVNREAQTKFFDEVKKKAGVQTSPTGLAYLIKEAGNDNKPSEQDTVFVHYKLSLKDGSVIEEVAEDQPSVMLMLNRVIPGWTEGLQLLGEGGKATLYVPAELGYGERGANAIEPNTPLVFDIQLDSVKHYVAPAE